MRRMYSEQELTRIIGEVFDQKLESGALDSSISDAVDAYLVEHPVDITALEGQDISLATLTSTGNVSIGGNLAVSGNITGASIIENMIGYAYVDNWSLSNATKELLYAGIVKNGNKLTLVLAFNITRTGAAETYKQIGRFNIPASVLDKLYPSTILQYDILESKVIQCWSSEALSVNAIFYIGKGTNNVSVNILNSGVLTENTPYYVRIETTFLLSDNLIPQE